MGPSFIRFQNMGRQVPGNAWWMVMAPGLMLMGLAFAILIWPQLLAYMVAFIIMSLGITVAGWGLRLRQIEKRRTSGQVHQQGDGQSVDHEPRASETIIYYDR